MTAVPQPPGRLLTIDAYAALGEDDRDGGNTAHVVYTRRITDDDLENLNGIDYGAHLFQPFVESDYAVRLTVVG